MHKLFIQYLQKRLERAELEIQYMRARIAHAMQIAPLSQDERTNQTALFSRFLKAEAEEIKAWTAFQESDEYKTHLDQK
jgi:hypothetical protein